MPLWKYLHSDPLTADVKLLKFHVEIQSIHRKIKFIYELNSLLMELDLIIIKQLKFWMLYDGPDEMASELLKVGLCLIFISLNKSDLLPKLLQKKVVAKYSAMLC